GIKWIVSHHNFSMVIEPEDINARTITKNLWSLAPPGVILTVNSLVEEDTLAMMASPPVLTIDPLMALLALSLPPTVRCEIAPLLEDSKPQETTDSSTEKFTPDEGDDIFKTSCAPAPAA